MAAPTICYEDAFGAEQLDFLPEAGLLLNVSNDAWFGNSLAPHQHLQIARMRALESGRFLLRATNTGISAVIGPQGTVLARSPQFETHVLTAEIHPRAGSTPYVRIGNAAVVVLAVLLLIAGSFSARRQT
jgi:apolipoprotein N-acyltransferase